MTKLNEKIALNSLKRDHVLATVQANQETLQKLGVKSLTLFGSVAKEQNHADK